MRSAINLTAALLLLASGCTPSVDIPTGNDKETSDTPVTQSGPPKIAPAPPATYPYATVAIRGTTNGDALRIFVSGAGNPIESSVNNLDGTFCVDVPLEVSPADYTLKIHSQSGDGKFSADTTVTIHRSNDAKPPDNDKLCSGASAKDDGS